MGYFDYIPSGGIVKDFFKANPVLAFGGKKLYNYRCFMEESQ